MNDIRIIIGESSDIISAIRNLEKALNELIDEYEFVSSMTVIIDRHITSVSNYVRYYATQMLIRKN